MTKECEAQETDIELALDTARQLGYEHRDIAAPFEVLQRTAARETADATPDLLRRPAR
jgi:hypothetical protein